MLRFYNKKDNGVLHIVFAMSLIVFMMCAVYLVQYAVDSIKASNTSKDAFKDFKNIKSIGDGELVDKYADMREEYPDVVGRIIFDNGSKSMEYLVMQTGADNPQKYLYADPHANYSKWGNPFMDYRCSVKENLTDNFLIYGHNMKDNTQFGSLDNNYKKESYWREHKTLRFETMYEDMQEYEIFAAFYSKIYRVGDDVFKYYKFFDAANKEEYDNYVSNVIKRSQYKTGIVPQYGEQLITLSTCSYHVENGRFVVVARKKGGRKPTDEAAETSDEEVEELVVDEEEEPEVTQTPTPTRQPTPKPTQTPTPTPSPTPEPTEEPEPTYESMTMTPTLDPGGDTTDPGYDPSIPVPDPYVP